ncbi:MAG: hypothetical protein ABS81_08080 [Pseudonocardia sp. SCN 72-86]|nr:MAG: hypothetical protein ABS81_08080 [Pseudonocardia sp. SCN 72-86]
MSISVHFVNGPAAGKDREYAHLTRPLPSLYIVDDDDHWRAVYHLERDSPFVAGRWQYRETPDST